MIDLQTQQRLQEVLRRESVSMLMYMEQAYPWATVREGPALIQLQQATRREREGITLLGRYMVRARIPLPYISSFPTGFTTINFLALDHLIPRLVASEKGLIELLEADMQTVRTPDAQATLEKVLQIKKDNLSTLEALHAAIQQPVSA